MLYLLDGELKDKVKKILVTLNIPLDYKFNIKEILELIKNDKKTNNNKIDLIKVNTIGTTEIINVDLEEIERILKEGE